MKYLKLFFVIVIILFSKASISQEYNSDEMAKTTILSFLESEERKGKLNGAVLITQKGKILIRKAFGYKDFNKKIKNSPETEFRIGSLTKQFVAVLILKLESEGLLKTSDFLSKYLPNYPNGNQITIEDLIHHTSGIPNFIFFTDYEQFMNKNQTSAQMMNRFKDLPLEFTPNSKYNYSNSGYFLLGVIIEKVTGLSFEISLKKYILNPLKLENTGINEKSEQLAQGYQKANIIAKRVDLSVPFAAGAMFSTIDDLYIWHKNLNVGFLNNTQNQKRLSSKFENYGYGVWVENTNFGRKIWHTGGINGFRAVMAYYEEKDTLIIVLNNIEVPDIEEFEQELAKNLLK